MKHIPIPDAPYNAAIDEMNNSMNLTKAIQAYENIRAEQERNNHDKLVEALRDIIDKYVEYYQDSNSGPSLVAEAVRVGEEALREAGVGE